MNPEWREPPSDISLSPDEVHVWYTDFNEIHDLGIAVTCLSADERARADRYKSERSKVSFVGSRIFLRSVLGRYLNVSPSHVCLENDEFGKPHLADPAEGLNFNLSHSNRSVVCAVCVGSRVGVDLELVSERFDEDTAAQAFSESEMQCLRHLGASEQQDAFLRGWTKKEAYAKCVGLGMSLDLKTVQTGFSEGLSSFRGAALLTFSCPNQAIATLAVDPDRPTVEFWRLPAGILLQ
jgi:4'-phosphopantetheinyl transferase